MNKVKYTALIAFCISALSVSSCGLLKNSDSSSNESSDSSQIQRYMSTTRTARHDIEENPEDEDLQGYTTTKEEETGTLENPLPDEPADDSSSDAEQNSDEYLDEEPESKAQNQTTAAELASDKLVTPDKSEKFKKKVKYKVTSDTTYLNLRFGPSKDYDIQLRIPDEKTVYGTARTQDSKGNYWIYTKYDGTEGWVMEELLTKK